MYSKYQNPNIEEILTNVKALEQIYIILMLNLA